MKVKKHKEFHKASKSSLRGYYKRKANGFQKGWRKNQRNSACDIDDGATFAESVVLSSHSDTPTISRPIQRHHADYFKDLVINTPANELSIPGADGIDGSAIVLRPKPLPTSNPDEIVPETEGPSLPLGEYNIGKGNILVEKSMLLDLFNTFTSEHNKAGTCNALCLDLIDFRPWGLFSSVVLTCKSCGTKSQRTNLFEDLRPPITLPFDS